MRKSIEWLITQNSQPESVKIPYHLTISPTNSQLPTKKSAPILTTKKKPTSPTLIHQPSTVARWPSAAEFTSNLDSRGEIRLAPLGLPSMASQASSTCLKFDPFFFWATDVCRGCEGFQATQGHTRRQEKTVGLSMGDDVFSWVLLFLFHWFKFEDQHVDWILKTCFFSASKIHSIVYTYSYIYIILNNTCTVQINLFNKYVNVTWLMQDDSSSWHACSGGMLKSFQSPRTTTPKANIQWLPCETETLLNLGDCIDIFGSEEWTLVLPDLDC